MIQIVYLINALIMHAFLMRKTPSFIVLMSIPITPFGIEENQLCIVVKPQWMVVQKIKNAVQTSV